MAPRRQEQRPQQHSEQPPETPPGDREPETVTGAQERKSTAGTQIANWTRKADEIAVKAGAGAALALREDVPFFTSHQLATLQHMGVAGAPLANLTVFFHQCLRTQLDPFTGQIHMIKRMVSVQDDDGTWRKEPRWTIQTGISGYYVIRERAAASNGDVIGYEDTIWYDEDGNAHAVWADKAKPPHAARVVLLRNGMRFPGLVYYSEVAGLRDGKPMAEWRRQPAHMLEKCADAFACRRCYPADFAGIYTDEEMGGWDHGAPIDPRAAAPVSVPRVARTTRRVSPATVVPPKQPAADEPPPPPDAPSGELSPDDAPITGVVVDEPGMAEPARSERPKNDRQRRMARLHALLSDLGVGGDELRPARLGICAMLARASESQEPLQITSTGNLTDSQLELCIGKLERIQRGAREKDEPLQKVQDAMFRLADAGGWQRDIASGHDE